MTSLAHLERESNRAPLRLVLHDDRQERVRKLLLHYCVPRIPGQTAWEIAGAILIALDATDYAQFEAFAERQGWTASQPGLPEFQQREGE